jgi:tetratricopeptide (TPR) repeat protein
MHRSLRKMFILAASLILVSLVAIPAMAQNRIIRGKINSDKMEPVTDAQISIQGIDVKREYSVKTDKKGEYFYMGLPSGIYRVVVRAKGFSADWRDGIKPTIGSDQVINFDLKPGDSTMKLPFEMTAQEIEKLKEDYKKAEKAKQASGEVKASFDVGLQLMQQAKYEEAIVEFKKALEKDPDQAYIQANLADAYAKTGKNDDALAAYQKAIQLKPDDAALYTNLGVLLGKMGKTKESQDMFKKAASINPGAAAQNFYNLGATLVNEGKADDAAEAFKQAIAADPNYAEAYFQLGLCLSGNQNALPDALKALNQYLKIGQKPDQIEVAKQLIQALTAKK